MECGYDGLATTSSDHVTGEMIDDIRLDGLHQRPSGGQIGQVPLVPLYIGRHLGLLLTRYRMNMGVHFAETRQQSASDKTCAAGDENSRPGQGRCIMHHGVGFLRE